MSAGSAKHSVIITPGQVRAFELLSHDRNGLHRDAVYARSTQFGRPVVYGMCSVLLALAKWSMGRAFQLVSIRGQFRKALFEDERYELQIVESNKQVTAEWHKGRD